MKRLRFHWTPTRQVFTCDRERFEKEGEARTEPSHDLVHLIVAAHGNMPWLPEGPRDEICLAEYNAVLLEHFFDKTYNAIHYGAPGMDKTFEDAVRHLRWFVDEHFKPFPISSEEAYRRFCRRVDVELVVRLCPYYFRLKRRERTEPDYRKQEHLLEFTSEDDPDVDDHVRAAQRAIRRQLKRVLD